MFFAYCVYNKEKNKIYIGQTDNTNKRVKRHNKKLPSKSKSFTNKNKGFWKLIYKESFDTREEAIKREKELKSAKGRRFLRNLIKK